MAIGSFRLPITSTSTPPPTTGDYLVRYIDFDGVIIKEEYVNSGNSATPPTPPTHTFLTFTEWNQSSTNINYNMDIGATYSTTDGKTYIFIELNVNSSLSPTIYLTKETTDTLTIDWGDTSQSTKSVSGNTNSNHTYSAVGSYIITLSCAGNYGIGNGTNVTQIFTSNYRYITKHIYIGSTCTRLEDYSFYNNVDLEYISIPNTTSYIGTGSFQQTYNLAAGIIPSGITTINNILYTQCYKFSAVSIPSTVTTILGAILSTCYSIKNIIIPPSVTSMSSGNSFINSYGLVSAYIYGTYTTVSGTLLQSCYNLKIVDISPTLTDIPTSCFANCYVLESLIFYSGITSIGSSAFNNCLNLLDYVFYSTTPPTLAALSAFGGINLFTKIYVPDASVSAYKAATNWISYKNYIYPLSTRP